LMASKPRAADESVLTKSHWLQIAVYGCVISAAVLGAMAIAIIHFQFDTARAVTVSFCTLSLAQLWHVFNMRDSTSSVFVNEITRNIWIWAAILICVALIVLATCSPLLSEVLGLVDPGKEGWFIILPMSILPLILAPFVRRVVPQK